MSWEDLDKAWSETEAAEKGTGGSFEPFPDGTKVKVVIIDTKPDHIGARGTPCVKTTFEICEPEVIGGEKAVGRKVWHDLWVTAANLKYLKRDLDILGWKGQRISAIMEDADTSLMGLGADVTLGIERFTRKNGEAGAKNIIKFFNEPFVFQGTPKGQSPSAPAGGDEPFPF